jgi:hypothetical protein
MAKRKIELAEKPKQMTAWWWTKEGDQVHVSELVRDPVRRDALALLDRLAFELELNA